MLDNVGGLEFWAMAQSNSTVFALALTRLPVAHFLIRTQGPVGTIGSHLFPVFFFASSTPLVTIFRDLTATAVLSCSWVMIELAASYA